MKVVIRIDADEQLLQSIAFLQDRTAGKRVKGTRLASRDDVHKYVADALNEADGQAKALREVVPA